MLLGVKVPAVSMTTSATPVGSSISVTPFTHAHTHTHTHTHTLVVNSDSDRNIVPQTLTFITVFISWHG